MFDINGSRQLLIIKFLWFINNKKINTLISNFRNVFYL